MVPHHASVTLQDPPFKGACILLFYSRPQSALLVEEGKHLILVDPEKNTHKRMYACNECMHACDKLH